MQGPGVTLDVAWERSSSAIALDPGSSDSRWSIALVIMRMWGFDDMSSSSSERSSSSSHSSSSSSAALLCSSDLFSSRKACAFVSPSGAYEGELYRGSADDSTMQGPGATPNVACESGSTACAKELMITHDSSSDPSSSSASFVTASLPGRPTESVRVRGMDPG
jgi:hypothetical protein